MFEIFEYCFMYIDLPLLACKRAAQHTLESWLIKVFYEVLEIIANMVSMILLKIIKLNVHDLSVYF